MSLPGTSPRTHTITTTVTTSTELTTVTSSVTANATSAAPVTTAAAPATASVSDSSTNTVSSATTSERSSPPKNDSPPGRSKKTVMPRSPRAAPIPVPVLRLRSTSSGVEVAPSTRKRPQASGKEGSASMSQSHPVHDMSRTQVKSSSSTTVTLADAKGTTTEQDSVRAYSEPSLLIIRKSIPLAQLKKMEQEHRMHKLADLLVNDLMSEQLSVASLSTLGHTDAAFYIEHLPEEFKPLASGLLHPTISSGKLMQRYFADDFSNNVGWNGATSMYANFMQREAAKSSSSRSSHMGDIDNDTQEAEMERIWSAAMVIVRSLLGYPPTVDSSPLPGKLISLLIACDQRLHAKLISIDKPAAFSTDQIRTARLAALTHLLVNRLLHPMLLSLASKNPSQSEMWFQVILKRGLVSRVKQLAEALFSKSFATSPLALQQQATEKATREKIDARIRQLQTKSSTRHVRTRSADTTPISPRTLRTIEEARSLRKVQKAGELATELESQDWSALDEANREVDENLAISQANVALQQFDAADLDELASLLAMERSDSEDIASIQPRRAQPLDDSEELSATTATSVTADALPGNGPTTASTFNTFNTTTESTVTTGTLTSRQPTASSGARITSGQGTQQSGQAASRQSPEKNT